MTDPTIPDLVARLRELHEKATPGPWSTNHRGGDISARIRGHEVQVALACGQGAMWDERDDAAAIMRANAELIAELRSALPAILDALDHVGDAAAHSPDGGKAGELDHAECSVSTGIDGALTAGQGELAPSGYWEHPCHECADRANASEVRRLQDIVDDLESRSTWWHSGSVRFLTQVSPGARMHIEGARVADRKPKFGDWFRNPHASDDNPTRDGMYVRTVRRTGRMNRGTWYELTDGTGKFWQVRPDALQPLTSSPWRPIEECGELEVGAEYLVMCVAPDGESRGPCCAWFGRAGWVVGSPYYGADSITHVHRMGPIRGPEEG